MDYTVVTEQQQTKGHMASRINRRSVSVCVCVYTHL